MNVLIDTNVLARVVDRSHPLHQTARDAVSRLGRQSYGLIIVPQVLYELWVVMTRPLVANGLGRTHVDAARAVNTFLAMFGILDDTPAIFPEWARLVSTHAVLGKNAHDARLVAAMSVHGLTHLLTFNAPDFQRFPGITVFTPAAVLSIP